MESFLTEAVPPRRPERLCSLVFPLLRYPIGFGHRLMSRWRRVMRSFGTGRGHVVGRILEPGHIRALQTGVLARVRGTRSSGQGRLSCVLSFHCFQLGLAGDFSFEAGLSVGIDGLFGKVVGAAAGWRGDVSEALGIGVRPGLDGRIEHDMGLKIRTDTESAPANPVTWVRSSSSALVAPD